MLKQSYVVIIIIEIILNINIMNDYMFNTYASPFMYNVYKYVILLLIKTEYSFIKLSK